MIVGGFFDGSAAAYLPAVFGWVALAACLLVLAAGVAAGLMARRRRDRQLDAIFRPRPVRRLTPYDHDAEGDFYEPTPFPDWPEHAQASLLRDVLEAGSPDAAWPLLRDLPPRDVA